ncbi:hypothetical protein L7F22_059394 [Adiantum nelumboides]|nr:hypothetical protein [Adiantum nelumboides]
MLDGRSPPPSGEQFRGGTFIENRLFPRHRPGLPVRTSVGPVSDLSFPLPALANKSSLDRASRRRQDGHLEEGGQEGRGRSSARWRQVGSSQEGRCGQGRLARGFKKPQAGVSDMTLLTTISNEAVNQNLEKRFRNGEIYTYIGSVLISVNPFRDLGIYTDEVLASYRGKNRLEMTPHVFAIAEGAYYNMIAYKDNQCVIISGESAQGKPRQPSVSCSTSLPSLVATAPTLATSRRWSWPRIRCWRVSVAQRHSGTTTVRATASISRLCSMPRASHRRQHHKLPARKGQGGGPV